MATKEAKEAEDRMDSGELTSMVENNGMGKYLYVNVISKRCKQLMTGSPRLAEPPRECILLADVAAGEIASDKLSVRPLPGNTLTRPLDFADANKT